MNTAKVFILQTTLFLFILNSVFLYFYFLPITDIPIIESHLPITESYHSNSKLWPDLPSQTPWTRNPETRSQTCEGFFGHGFTILKDLLGQGPSEKAFGWFRCYRSETLTSSVCEGGRFRMFPNRIRMSVGGEALESVLGRTEDDELPVFQFGAFDLDGRNLYGDDTKIVTPEVLDYVAPSNGNYRHAMRGLIDSIRVVRNGNYECSQWIEEPTLLVTRFEYANLFHTVTDWYSAYAASRVAGLSTRPHVIFVDGHCKAPLEETWKALFSSVQYAKDFHSPVCFRHAILSPLGYETALFKGLSQNIDCEGVDSQSLHKHLNTYKTLRLSEFGEMLQSAHGFPINTRSSRNSMPRHNVLFVRREDYLAHPRHSGKPESRLSNEQEVFDSLKTWVSSHLTCNVSLVNGRFAHMTMKEQVESIKDASVIIGAHGAGLTHIISATPGTVVLEIISSQYRRPHFELIARWRGLEYHAINLHGSYADPTVVVDRLRSILRSLWC